MGTDISDGGEREGIGQREIIHVDIAEVDTVLVAGVIVRGVVVVDYLLLLVPNSCLSLFLSLKCNRCNRRCYHAASPESPLRSVWPTPSFCFCQCMLALGSCCRTDMLA